MDHGAHPTRAPAARDLRTHAAELPHPVAASVGECCAQCDAYADCIAAVFASGQCWMKSANYTK